jgi:NAD-dependent deacetylase
MPLTSAEHAIELMRQASRIVALSGAGISTEAGIPDFRGPNGLYQDPSLFAQLSARGFAQNPAGFYRAGLKLFPNITRAKPTAAHHLLSRLEQSRKLRAVVTQNIDGLHQAAGSRQVFEIHGTFRTGHCTGCRASYEMQGFYEAMRDDRSLPPLCTRCHKPIKPDLVLFDDLLPFDVWEASVGVIENCDLLLVFGSSLQVYPAAELPQYALDRGARLVIVNLEETPYDRRAAAVVRDKLGIFATTAVSALGFDPPPARENQGT